MKNNRVIIITLIISFFAIFTLDAYAVENSKLNVCIDGVFMDFDDFGLEPILENGRVLAPFRQIFESLDFDVAYNSVDKSATISKNNTVVTIWDGEKQFLVKNDNYEEYKELDVIAKTTSNGRFVIPIRAITEALEMDIEWNQNYNIVFIFSDNKLKTKKNIIIERAKGVIDSDKYNDELGLSPIYKGMATGFIDKTGKIVTNYIEGTMRASINNGLIMVNRDGLYGYVDYTGEFIIEPQFINAHPFSDGVAIVVKKEDYARTIIRTSLPDETIGTDIIGFTRYSVIDTTGKTLFTLPDGNYFSQDFQDGIAIYTDNNHKQHYITKKGETLNIGDPYTDLNSFSEGIATVKIVLKY